MKLKDLLFASKQDEVYIARYSIYNKEIWKTCTLNEFLKELVEYSEREIAYILTTVNFSKF